MRIKASNNIVAFLTIVFILITLYSNIRIHLEAGLTEPRMIGRATINAPGDLTTDSGIVNFCINARPRINISCVRNVTAYYLYLCIVNATDPDNDTLGFYDNSAAFDIDQESGILLKYPRNSEAGNHLINITVNDGHGCINSEDSAILNLTVFFNYPPIIASYQPNISKYNRTFPKVNISENHTLIFRARYYDMLNETVSAELLFNSVARTSQIPSGQTLNYNYATNFLSAGIYYVKLRVWDQFNLTTMMNWTVNVTNVNRPPVWIRTLARQEWYKNGIQGAYYLDDYVYDPDTDDTLRFNINYHDALHNIIADINPTSRNYVVFSQQRNWIGSEQVHFTVKDNWGANASSNNVTLVVIEPPNLPPSQQGPGAGGGGGNIRCIEEWYCERWAPCPEDLTTTRKCVDLNNCNTLRKKPNTTMACVYIPQCFNGVQDLEEEGLDCGGRCQACATCNDRLQNQGEEGIDCGGPCDDCTYAKRPRTEQPAGDLTEGTTIERIQEEIIGLIYIIASALTLFTLALLFATRHMTLELYYRLLAVIWKRKTKKETLEKQKETREQVLDALESVYGKIGIEKIEESARRVNEAVSLMFKSILQVDYQLTLEELKKEIQEKKIEKALGAKMVALFTQLEHIRYGDDKSSPGELKSIIDDLRKITAMSVQESKEQTERGLREITKLSNEAIADLEKATNIENAKKIYKSVIENYDKLPEEQKMKVYPAVRKLYDLIGKGGAK